MICAFYNN